MRNRQHSGTSSKRVPYTASHKNQQVTPLDASLQNSAPMIQTMQPHAFQNDNPKSRRVLAATSSRGGHRQSSNTTNHPRGSMFSESSTTSRSDNGPCENETLSTKTIPLPEYHVPKTKSELQLQDDMVAAELRDYCMFRRLVEGMQKRCLETKKHRHSTKNHYQQPQQPAFAQGATAGFETEAPREPGRYCRSKVASVPVHEETVTDDYGHFVIDDPEMIDQGLTTMGGDASDRLQTSQKSFAFPNLTDSDQQTTFHAKNRRFGQNDISEKEGAKTQHHQSSFDEDDADDSIFVLDL